MKSTPQGKDLKLDGTGSLIVGFLTGKQILLAIPEYKRVSLHKSTNSHFTPPLSLGLQRLGSG